MQERQRRSFTEEYKRQAAELVVSSGRSITAVGKELGLRDSVLRRWVEKLRRTRPPRSLVCARRTSGCAWSGTF
jgi:transposase-like protein